MIYLSDIQELISDWTDRLDNPTYPQSYRDALGECIYDLNTMIVKSVEEEMDAFESLKSQLPVHDKAA